MQRMFGPISYGKVREPGAPKLPRWIWTCDCAECAQIDISLRIHGPFKTLRQAMSRRRSPRRPASHLKFIDGGELPCAQH